MPLKLKHGTTTAYDRHGCRCHECRQYKSNQNAKRPRKPSMGGSRKFGYFCPECPLGFYTDDEFKEHWKSRHVKE